MDILQALKPAAAISMHVDATRQLSKLSVFFIRLEMGANYVNAFCIFKSKIGALNFEVGAVMSFDDKLRRSEIVCRVFGSGRTNDCLPESIITSKLHL